MSRDPYTRLYLWLVSHRPLVFTATILLTLVCILISSRLNLEEDILGLLPERDKIVDDYKYTLRKFRQIDRVYIDVRINEPNSDVLGQAADEFYSRISTNSSITRIMYRFEVGGQRKVLDFLTGALPNLFSEADANALTNKLDPAKIRAYLTDMRRRMAGFESVVLKDMVAADPIWMTELVANKVLPLQTGFGDAKIDEGGRITSGDGKHVLIMAEPKFGSSNSKESEALVADLLSAAREVEAHFPGVHIAMTGGHRMSVDNATLIKHDARRCIFLGMASMGILCLTAYRRRWLATITFLPSLFGTLAAGVVLALWHNQISAIATGFATIAIGITVDYAIYIIYHLDDAGGLDPEAVGHHVGRLVLPITAGSLTTVAAFVVMASSPMHGYQQLGVFGAAGVVFSAAFAIIILPLLVPIPKEKGQPPLWLTRLMEKFSTWRGRNLSWLIIVVVLASIFTAVGIRRLRFEGDVSKFNGITEPTRADEALIRKTWGDALGMTLVVARGATEEEALEKNDHAAEVLAKNPDVKSVYSLSAVCPSQETQKANIRRWLEFWTPERRQTLRQNLQQISTELGFSTNAFDVFWQRVETEPKVLTLELFRGTPLDQVLNERVALAPGDNAVTTLLKLDDRAKADTLRKSLPEMIILDQRAFAEHIADLAKSGLRNSAFWIALLVMAILYFSMGSIELVIITLLPLALGLLWTFGAMGWLGLPIDMMNSMFVIFIIGVGEDYGVFFVTSKLDVWRGMSQRLAATSASVLISALTTIFGFAVLVVARHPVLFSMGTTVLLGMVFSFAATLIVTPFLMDLLLLHPQPRGAPRWWHILGTFWVLIHLGSAQFFLYYILRPILKLLRRPHADDEVRAATRWMARGVVKWMPFGKLEFQNISRETFAKPGVVISNHQSSVDVMLIVSLPGDVRQTAKKRVFDNPMLGIGCKVLGHVLVEPDQPEVTLQRCREVLSGNGHPGSAARAASGGAATGELTAVTASTGEASSGNGGGSVPASRASDVTSTLPRASSTVGSTASEASPSPPLAGPAWSEERAGERRHDPTNVSANRPTPALVHFFPEGTRSHDGFLQRFHRGAFELAIELNQDILPIVLCDSWTAVPRDAYWFERFHTTVRAWPRITPENFDYSKGSLALMRHCESVVRDALQKQLDEINTPKVLRRKVDRLYRYQGKFVEQFVHWKMKMDPLYSAPGSAASGVSGSGISSLSPSDGERAGVRGSVSPLNTQPSTLAPRVSAPRSTRSGILDSVVPDGFILDLGCGYGIATNWLNYCRDTRTFLGVDYDETKIRIAQQSAADMPRVRFELQNLLEWEYPQCDAVLLLDVLHYWAPDKQQLILNKARKALRPGGRLILREAAREANSEHRHVELWERFATKIGHNQTKDGLHFRTIDELTGALKEAGLTEWEINRNGGNHSNVLLVAS